MDNWPTEYLCVSGPWRAEQLDGAAKADWPRPDTAATALAGNTGTVTAFSIGSVVLTRVPYFDVALDVDVIGFTSPLFPNVRIVITERELDHVDAHRKIGGRSASLELVAQGVVDGVQCPHEFVRCLPGPTA